MDLFAGAGGFGLGFSEEKDSYNLFCSLEKDDWAVETLKANNSNGHKIIHDDIRNFHSCNQIRERINKTTDVIIGGPPCQGFSYAGPAKDPNDPRNTLFINYAQWVDVLRPKVFVMENVKGILTGVNASGEKVIDIIKKTFKSKGYYVNIWELNAAHYGVPQNRERIFIVGNRDGKDISEPARTHFLPLEEKGLNGSVKSLRQAISVIQAIGDLPNLDAGQGAEVADFVREPLTEYQIDRRRGASKLFNHVTMRHTKRIVKRYAHIIEGKGLNELPEEFKVRKRNGNGELSNSAYHSNYRHLKEDMISYTIPASFYSNFVHPNQPRNITSREAARLQSFPDSYVFKGKRTQISSKLLKQLGKEAENYLSQYNQIGNAVPPLLANAIAKRIYNFLVSI